MEVTFETIMTENSSKLMLVNKSQIQKVQNGGSDIFKG
jgi:hypothetical protein